MAPQQLLVIITGLQDNNGCQCDQLNGIYVVDLIDAQQSTCQWFLTFEPEGSFLQVDITKFPEFRIDVKLHQPDTPGICQPANDMFWDRVYASIVDCLNLNDTIPFSDDDSDLGGCDASGSTLRIVA